MNACKHLAPCTLCRDPLHGLRWPLVNISQIEYNGKRHTGEKPGSTALLISGHGWHCGSRSVLLSWPWVSWALLPSKPQTAIMRNPQCMSFRDEWIIYLGGFKTNLPFLLSKPNHNGIHIGLIHWYDDFKAWTEWGQFTEFTPARIWQKYDITTRWNAAFSLDNPNGDCLLQESNTNCFITAYNLFLRA